MDPSSLSSVVPFPSSYSSYKRKRDDDDEAFDGRKRPKHDVFLSYSNEDIGKSFVSHLKGALKRNGFAISDNTSLPVAQDESSELLKAIEDSGIYVVVFSSKYPFSVKCLDELVLIMDSISKFKKRRVVPIFFKVDPSHVRSQEDGSFLEAFQTHRHNNVDGQTVAKWRQSLQYVGKKAGEHLKTGENEQESVCKIVKMLVELKLPLELFDADHKVGIERREQDLIPKLRLGDPDPSITAVLGMSGSGKTTLVKAVYDRIVADFDASCFIESISYYKHDGPKWKVALQREVISRFTGDDYRIHNVVAASNIINFVSSRKVLLVLDDVDKFEQLQALGIHHHASFGWGSRILVTTTNKQSLGNLPYSRYDISLLDKSESFQLFVGLAYGKDKPVDKQFVDEIVTLAGGLPLVLDIWGHHFSFHERKQWPRILEKIRRIPHEDVQKKLQVSYDSLSPRAKNLFLDIASFFDGEIKDLVIKVLEDEDNAFFPDIEIQDLIDKGLLQVYDTHHLRMHAVIRDMGREVLRQENEDDPGQRSRLVVAKDVVRVLRDCSGTDSIISICLKNDDLDEDEDVTVQVEAFRKMSNLRFIKVIDSYLNWCSSNDDMSTFSFKHLKYLEWHWGFPFKCLDKFDMGNVVVIKLFQSKLEILWEGAFKSLKKLRILHVSFSDYLTRTGSFIGLENLEELGLINCENLEELDGSIGCLQKLVTLNVTDCQQLKRVPWEMIGKLTSLATIDLSHCPNILNISHELGNLKSLKEFPSLPDSLCQLHQLSEIELFGCANLKSIPNLPPNIQLVRASDCSSLMSLPSNMSELQFLINLVLDNCKELGSEGFVKVVTGLRNLRRLSMRNCNVSQVSSEIGDLVSLVELNLSKNTFSSLPDSIRNLSRLKVLEINDCHKLKLLPLLPSKLREITACGCWSLDVMPFDSRQMAYVFRSQWCRQLLVNSGTEEEEEEVVNSQRRRVVIPRKLIISLSVKEEVVIPGWCSYTSIDGEELCYVAPITTQLDKKICGLIFYCNITDCDFRKPITITMLNKTKGTRHGFYQFRGPGSVFSVCIMGLYPLVVEAGDTLHLIPHGEVSSCGLSWIYEDDVVDNSAIFVRYVNGVEPSTTLSNDEVCIFHTTNDNDNDNDNYNNKVMV